VGEGWAGGSYLLSLKEEREEEEARRRRRGEQNRKVKEERKEKVEHSGEHLYPPNQRAEGGRKER